MKIVIDIGGCDNPSKMVNGVYNAAREFHDYTMVVVGDKELIEKSINADIPDNFIIEHAPDIITNDDTPTRAIRQKPDSSLVRAFKILNESDDVVGLLSGGSTGAVLTGATLLVGRIKGVHRPVLASLLPTAIDGKRVCVADCGANVDSKPEFLAQFGVMADIYIRALMGVENPRVALLSVGTEEHKGDERSKAAYALLKEQPINFVGNMEARDVLTGDYDIVVSDGFAGNVLIKSVEGTAKMVMGQLKKAMFSSFKSKLGALMMKKSLKGLKTKMDYHAYGGAAFLGVKKIVVKTHGSSNEVSTRASVANIIKMYEHHIIDGITAGIAGTADIDTENKSE